MNEIYNEDCLDTMRRMKENGVRCNIILTSPPYNTGRASTTERKRDNHEARYDIHLDTMTPEQYCNWCVELFYNFDNILERNGVVAWNVSYGADKSWNENGIGLMWLSIADIIRYTNFTVADRIIWKKNSAIPITSSTNKLTRIVEDIFIFCRKSEIQTYQCNKQVSNISAKGQQFYAPIYNFIEAPNNDGSCKLNKATYSSKMCEKILNIYSHPGDIVYDPFMGTGTTAVAVERLGLSYLGSELSAAQCEFAEERIAKERKKYTQTRIDELL